jgi:endonuclease/exonuclease/phosphatase family metal-dependent hydrolase
MEQKGHSTSFGKMFLSFKRQIQIIRNAMAKPMLAFALGILLLGPISMPAAASGDFSPPGIKVMTQNLYVGADIFRPATAEDLDDFYELLEETFLVLGSTNIFERAQAVAAEVARHRPHLIGLQEVYRIQRQDPFQTLDLDYLAILEQALEEQGLHYRTVGSVQNLDLFVPILMDGSPVGSVTLTDRDVILARGDVDVSDISWGNYTAKLPVPVPFPPGSLEVPRGYVAVHATIGERTFFFVNTHLEQRGKDLFPADDPRSLSASVFQVAQAQELIARIASEPGPVIVVGDFNSDPRDPVLTDSTLPLSLVPPYKQFSFSGYRDVWRTNLLRLLNPDGFTCCQDEALNNAVSALDERIDFIFVRNKPEGLTFSMVGPVFAVVVGDEQRDKTETSPALWPSDHGGVVAWLSIPERTEPYWGISPYARRIRHLKK